jgi:hypothetical protein
VDTAYRFAMHDRPSPLRRAATARCGDHCCRSSCCASRMRRASEPSSASEHLGPSDGARTELSAREVEVLHFLRCSRPARSPPSCMSPSTPSRHIRGPSTATRRVAAAGRRRPAARMRHPLASIIRAPTRWPAATATLPTYQACSVTVTTRLADSPLCAATRYVDVTRPRPTSPGEAAAGRYRTTWSLSAPTSSLASGARIGRSQKRYRIYPAGAVICMRARLPAVSTGGVNWSRTELLGSSWGVT